MANESPLGVASRRMRPKDTDIVEATLKKAVENSRNIDVDKYFYSPVIRPNRYSTSDDVLLAAIAEQAPRVGLRLDFLVGDLYRFTIIGARP